jgi:hypothetical protein
MLVSEAGARPVSADANLISPPRGWPETFKSNAMLKTFLNKTLQGRKARLVAPATAEVAVEATLSPPLESADCASVAARVYAELSWPVLEGVAVYELDEAPDTFVAFRYKWNLHPRNIWVDLAARPPKHPQLLLVECDVNAAFGRGNEVLSSASPPPQAAQQPLPEATPPSLPPPPPSSEPTGASPPVATAPPAPARTYEQILASLPLGPKALEKQLIMEGALPKRGKPKRDPHKVIGVFKAQPDAKRRWPPMAAEVRLRLRADRSIELEARCWRKGTEEEELQRMLYAWPNSLYLPCDCERLQLFCPVIVKDCSCFAL